MNKDEIWEKIKKDKTEVYGQSMLDMFLKTTDKLKNKHYDELSEDKKRLVGPELRLRHAGTVAEANDAIKDGAKGFNLALYYAAKDGRLEVVKILINRGADQLSSALEVAALSSHSEIIRFLVEKGAKNKDTALSYSAKLGNLEIVKFLVEKGAKELEEALNHAAQRGHLEIVKFLWGNGAKDLHMALQLAAENGQLEVVKFLAERAWERGLEVALRYAFNSAVKSGHPEVAEFLKSRGAK
jgi:ankyrin repeat protein